MAVNKIGLSKELMIIAWGVAICLNITMVAQIVKERRYIKMRKEWQAKNRELKADLDAIRGRGVGDKKF